jgi:dTDP-4-amino-4,6-dideoxygalactose transaminase
MKIIKFLDLHSQYESIKNEIDLAIESVLQSSNYVLGPEVLAFESEFSKRHNVEYAVAVNSGTSALHLALMAVGVGPGDEVITTPMTFIATSAAIAYTGARPIFVDIDERSMTIDVEKIEEKITKKTKAIVPVHLYGQPANMREICRIAKKYNLRVVEDAAQAHLAKFENEFVGGFGDAAAFSFYPGKNLGGYGEGGLVLTKSNEIASKIRLLRDWGAKEKYQHEVLGFNFRMDALQGAILRVKLKYLADWTRSRQLIAENYIKGLSAAGIKLAEIVPDRIHVFHIFSVFCSDRDALQTYLNKNGIQTGKHYPIPIHLQKAFSYLGHQKGDFPISESVANNQLSLPIYPEISLEDINYVCQKVHDFLKSK